jgi:hypothetical protein
MQVDRAQTEQELEKLLKTGSTEPKYEPAMLLPNTEIQKSERPEWDQRRSPLRSQQ